MAHFAQIADGMVVQVIVINNDVVGEYPGSDATGKEFITSIGLDGEWVQTSYNGNFRGCFAGVGYTWDGTNFVAPPVVEPE
jgi:hypothetical protein